jgi:hypothetical protein
MAVIRKSKNDASEISEDKLLTEDTGFLQEEKEL